MTCVKRGFISNVAFSLVSSFDSLGNSDLPYFCTKCNSDILSLQNVNDEELSNNLTVTEFAMSKMDTVSKILQVSFKNVACSNQYLNTQDFNSQTNLLKPPIFLFCV